MTSRELAAQEFANELAAAGRKLPSSAAMLLEAYAGQVARMRDARARVDDEGEIVAGPRDQPIPHPALQIERAATTEVARLHKQLLACSTRA